MARQPARAQGSAGAPAPAGAGARWDAVALAVGVAAAAFAVFVTVRASFLAYPEWLAAQKVDLILGPLLVGLYWRRVRPASRFGLVLIGYGLLNIGYIAQSFSDPNLFGVGVLWESFIYLGAQYSILTFPTGRVEGIATKLVLAGSVATAALNVWLVAMLPQTGAGGAISHCRRLCPANGLAVEPNVGRALSLFEPFDVFVIAVAAATILLLAWRFVRGTQPQRRALAIGAPVAILFLLCQIAYLSLSLLDVKAPRLERDLQWAFTGARSAVWYGYLAALLAAQLFAARVLRTMVGESLRRPSVAELEQLLRRPLGDAGLRLTFWRPAARAWVDAAGREAPAAEAGPGQLVTEVQRDGSRAVAIVHDAQLADDPELLQAAGATALLALENAELEAAWNGALQELRESRARIVRAGDTERRKLERDLHDGVQQRLVATAINLGLTAERASSDPKLRGSIEQSATSVTESLHELREISHGIYPSLLAGLGLASALRGIRRPGDAAVEVTAADTARYPADIESAVYYCCLEAIQNASKHGGADTRITVRLQQSGNELEFAIEDDGAGFDPALAAPGTGLQNMRDRVGALDGHVSITSAPGEGTIVSGAVPLP